MICFLVVLFALSLQAEPAPNMYGVSMSEAARQTGYSEDEIRDWFPPIEKWQELGIDTSLNAEDYDPSRFSPPPQPYVHPRILISPSDIPGIRKRIKETESGRINHAALHDALKNVRKHSDYQKLSSGNIAGLSLKDIQLWVLNGLAAEALICMLDEDEVRGNEMADAVESFARLIQQDIEQLKSESDWSKVFPIIRADTLGLAYDFGYEFFSNTQKTLIRRLISDLTKNKTYPGLDHLPVIPASTNGWFITQAHLMTLAVAIEGEDGFNEDTYRQHVEALRRWVFVASSTNGTTYEGLPRTAFSLNWLVPLAKRGVHLFASPNVKNHIRKYHLHAMLPWGIGKFVFQGGINYSRDIDAELVKYAYPNDPAIDLVYLNSVGSNYERYQRTHFGGRGPNQAAVYHLLFGLDYERAWVPAMTLVAQTEPLTFYDDYRGDFVTRSEWSPNALHLVVKSSHVDGAHNNTDRNSIVFSAHGTVWLNKDSNFFSGPEWFSTVLTDSGRIDSSLTIPLAISDNELASFHSSDARWCYRNGRQEHDIPFSLNDSRLEKSPLPWMSLPRAILPSRFDCTKPGSPQFRDGINRWRGVSAEYAVRTAGLVRGKRPYAFICDNLKLDELAHIYQWQGQLVDDVEVESIRVGDKDNGPVIDFLIREKDDDKSASEIRRLLIRVVDVGTNEHDRSTLQQTARVDRFLRYDHRMNSSYKRRVMLPMLGVTSRYRVLLCPMTGTPELPLTEWNSKRSELTISWPGQSDHIRFSDSACGANDLVIRRTAGQFAGLTHTLRHPNDKPISDEEMLASVRDTRAWKSLDVVASAPRVTKSVPEAVRKLPVLKHLHGETRKHLVAGPDVKDGDIVKPYRGESLTPVHPRWQEWALYDLEGVDDYVKWMKGELGGQYHSRIAAINLSHWEGSYRQLRFIDVRERFASAVPSMANDGKLRDRSGLSLASNMNRLVESLFTRGENQWNQHYQDEGEMWRGRWISYHDGHLRVILSPHTRDYVVLALDALTIGRMTAADFSPRYVRKGIPQQRNTRTLPPGTREIDTANGRRIVVSLDFRDAKLVDIQDRLGPLLDLNMVFEETHVATPIDPADDLSVSLDEEDVEDVEVDIPLDVEERKRKEPKLYTFTLRGVDTDQALRTVARATGNDCDLSGHRAYFRKPLRLKLFDVTQHGNSKQAAIRLMKTVGQDSWEHGKEGIGFTRRVVVPMSWAGKHYLAINADEETMRGVEAFLEDRGQQPGPE